MEASAGTWQRVWGIARAVPLQSVIILSAVIGIGISLYLTEVHYQAVPLICSTSGYVDCASVLKSRFGVVPGTAIPITFPGILWFLVSGGLALTDLVARIRNQAPPTWLYRAQAAWGAVGIVSILYLIYAEIVVLHHLCAWCTGVHALVVLTFMLALYQMQDAPAPVKPAPAARRPAPRATARRR